MVILAINQIARQISSKIQVKHLEWIPWNPQGVRWSENHESGENFPGRIFVYTMGVQTVIYVAALFGKDVLLLKSEEMLTTILLIQLIGIAGAYFFAFLANRIGNKSAIFVSLIIWTIACSLAFKLEPRHPGQFLPSLAWLAL